MNLTEAHKAAAFEWLRYLAERHGNIDGLDRKQAEIALRAWHDESDRAQRAEADRDEWKYAAGAVGVFKRENDELRAENARLKERERQLYDALWTLNGHAMLYMGSLADNVSREVGAALATPPPEDMPNQCDGCQRGLPVRDGMHYDAQFVLPQAVCTADRYTSDNPEVPTDRPDMIGQRHAETDQAAADAHPTPEQSPLSAWVHSDSREAIGDRVVERSAQRQEEMMNGDALAALDRLCDAAIAECDTHEPSERKANADYGLVRRHLTASGVPEDNND